MKLALAAMAVSLLAACPKRGGGSTAPDVTTGAGCPAASGVYLASYLQPPDGGKGHAGWVLPLFVIVISTFLTL
jgi:hypothetical protein